MTTRKPDTMVKNSCLGILAAMMGLLPAHVHSAKWDVVVYGSTPAGISAATAAGNLGLKVTLYHCMELKSIFA